MPAFQHDCSGCIFLGHYQGHDLYFCPQNGLPTVIARYSSEGSDYKSGMPFADGIDPELTEAKKRAVEKGIFRGKS
jgi:hypothetical protein